MRYIPILLAVSATVAWATPAERWSTPCGGFVGTCLIEKSKKNVGKMTTPVMKQECICRMLKEHPECAKEGYVCTAPAITQRVLASLASSLPKDEDEQDSEAASALTLPKHPLLHESIILETTFSHVSSADRATASWDDRSSTLNRKETARQRRCILGFASLMEKDATEEGANTALWALDYCMGTLGATADGKTPPGSEETTHLTDVAYGGPKGAGCVSFLVNMQWMMHCER